MALPRDLDPEDERKQREDAAIASIDARLVSGTLSPEHADREILELALERFAFLPEDALDELREVGLAMNEEPEMVETRSRAPRPDEAEGDV